MMSKSEGTGRSVYSAYAGDQMNIVERLEYRVRNGVGINRDFTMSISESEAKLLVEQMYRDINRAYLDAAQKGSYIDFILESELGKSHEEIGSVELQADLKVLRFMERLRNAMKTKEYQEIVDQIDYYNLGVDLKVIYE